MRLIPLMTTFALLAAVGCENASDRTNTTTNKPSNPPSRTTPTTPSDRMTPPSTPGAATPSANVAESDKTFVTNAASGGMLEVQLSQWMMQQPNIDASVKHVAQMMIDDHGKANDELKSIAQRKGITISPTLQPKHQSLIDQVKSQTGTAAQQKYLDIQVQAHKDTIAMFEDAVNTLKDPDLKSFAQKTLPTLRKHLDELQQISLPSAGESPMP